MPTPTMFAAGVGAHDTAIIWAALAQEPARASRASSVVEVPAASVQGSLSTRPARQRRWQRLLRKIETIAPQSRPKDGEGRATWLKRSRVLVEYSR